MPTARTLTAAVAAALLLAACSDASLPEPPEGYAFAYATPACGPADGPAVRVFLTAQVADSLPPPGARLELAVWRSAAELSGAELAWSGASNLGWAGRCDDVGQCEPATDVRVKFRGFAADSTLTGTIDFSFADGPPAAGGFTAVWRPATPLCG